MNRHWMLAAMLALALLIPSVARAHEGHVHKVMGTVSSVKGNHVEVKTTEGKTVMITINAKTTITRGMAKLDATALKADERVSIDTTEDKGVMIAQAIKLGTVTPVPPAAAAKK